MRRQESFHHYSTPELFAQRPLNYISAFLHRDYQIEMHTHDFYEVNILVHGSGRHYIEANDCDVTAGHVFIIPPMIRHGYEQPDNPDVFHMLIRPEFIERYAMELYSLPAYRALFEIEPALRTNYDPAIFLQLTPEQLTSLLPLLDALMAACTRADDVSAISLALLLIARLCEYGRCNQEGASADGRMLVISCMEYLHTHLQEHITLQDLTRQFHVSRSSLLRHFRLTCGEAPLRYLLRCRTEQAALLLRTTTAPIADIAAQCGFFDQSHLTKAFKQLQGCTPLKYRKEAQQHDGPPPVRQLQASARS